MKILVCYKYIKDEEAVFPNPDRTLNTDKAVWVISPYDLNAIEASMKLAAAVGDSTVEVISVGGDVLDNSKMRKAVLSRGPAKMNGVRVENCGDLFSTASLLKQAIEKMGDVDLVVCGEGSGDMYSQEMGNVLAALLDVPALNGVDQLSYDNGFVIARRNNGCRTESLKLNGLCVVSVSSDICPAHLPSMKEILAAGKKPVEIQDASAFDCPPDAAETVSVLAPESAERMKIVYKASDENGLDNFVKAIKKVL